MQVYTFGGYRWHVVLAKAGKKGAVTPGQLGLFDEQSHPRDESGRFKSKGEAVSHVKSHIPGEIEKLKTSADQLHSRIKTMSYDELDNYDPDGDFWDNHVHASIQSLGEKIKDHPDAEDIMDEDEHFEDIHKFHNETSDRLSSALNQRQEEISNHASEIHTETFDALDKDLSEVLESIDDDNVSFDDWHDAKLKLNAAYNNRLKEGYHKLKAIGASNSDFDDLTEELRGQLNDALDQYSNDPTDWFQSGDEYQEWVAKRNAQHAKAGAELMRENKPPERKIRRSKTGDEAITNLFEGSMDKLDNELKSVLTTVDDRGSFEDWQAAKGKLKSIYQEHQKNGLKALKEAGAEPKTIDSWNHYTQESYESAIDEFSSDPEDWQDDPEEDEE